MSKKSLIMLAFYKTRKSVSNVARNVQQPFKKIKKLIATSI
jgi:hypothetical protein